MPVCLATGVKRLSALPADLFAPVDKLSHTSRYRPPCHVYYVLILHGHRLLRSVTDPTCRNAPLTI
jgi:hypothetical protein